MYYQQEFFNKMKQPLKSADGKKPRLHHIRMSMNQNNRV